MAAVENAALPAAAAAAGGAVSATHDHGRIGPNAITRVAEALLDEVGAAARTGVFSLAGLDAYLRDPPQQMVDEKEVIGLHEVLRARLSAQQARRVNRDAGARTGAYLLAHRIPRPVQRLLRVLPAPLAARVLVAAIRRHAWTFAGTAAFSARGGRPVAFTLAGCPLCRGARTAGPCCDFYAACFEHLFRDLVHRHATVRETACAAAGDAVCRFDVRW